MSPIVRLGINVHELMRKSFSSPDQREYLAKALAVPSKVPSFTAQNTDEEDGMWKNTWNWNLA